MFFSKSNSNLTFTLVTDPFCKHCKYLHHQLDFFLKDVPIDSFSVNTIFNIDIEEEQGKDKLLYSTMASLQKRKGNMFFFQELREWYGHEDIDKWLLKRNISATENVEANHILSEQNQWCKSNGINYTPALFVNGYKLPDIYTIENLQYFIDDIIDADF